MDMLLASSVMLSKIINSTFGNGEIRGFDDTVVDKVYDEFKSNIRMIGSDKLLCAYPNEDWIVPAGGLDGWNNMTDKSIRFSMDGIAVFKMTLKQFFSAEFAISLCDGNGNLLQTLHPDHITLGDGETEASESFEGADVEISIPFTVEKDTDYKINVEVLAKGLGGVDISNLDLRICADVDILGSQMNYTA